MPRHLMPIVLGLLVLAAGCTAARASQSDQNETARVPLTQALPPLDGSRVKVTVVEVRYGPGGRSAAHSHPCPVIGYVIEGRYRTQVRGGPVEVFRAGQSFYEPPNGVHSVSANASDQEPVRFLATFVCDHDRPLTTAAPADTAPR